MPIERSADHPRFELGGATVTSFAAPARGAHEVTLYRVDLPPSHGLPAHSHDHLDVFTVVAGETTFQLGEETFELNEGDSVVVPIGVRHVLEAGPGGASIIVTMLPGNRMFRDDGSVSVPPWVQ
jgi:quercetin dioxygenase-like cupin family protein